jgi:hypothetical protein
MATTDHTATETVIVTVIVTVTVTTVTATVIVITTIVTAIVTITAAAIVTEEIVTTEIALHHLQGQCSVFFLRVKHTHLWGNFEVVIMIIMNMGFSCLDPVVIAALIAPLLPAALESSRSTFPTSECAHSHSFGKEHGRSHAYLALRNSFCDNNNNKIQQCWLDLAWACTSTTPCSGAKLGWRFIHIKCCGDSERCSQRR